MDGTDARWRKPAANRRPGLVTPTQPQRNKLNVLRRYFWILTRPLRPL
jgi:hypothetical protein